MSLGDALDLEVLTKCLTFPFTYSDMSLGDALDSGLLVVEFDEPINN